MPVIGGAIIAGVCTAMVPMFNELYPYYCVLRILIGLGTSISINIPFLADYVEKES